MGSHDQPLSFPKLRAEVRHEKITGNYMEGQMRIVIAGGVFALLAFAATAAELTPDVRAKLDRYIDEKTLQACTDQQNAGSPVKADECFATTKPLIKRDLEEAFQNFQQWQIDSEHEGNKSEAA